MNLRQRTGFLLALQLLVSVAAFPRSTRAGQVVLDDFEAPTAPAPWTFSNGGEFPGATGSLSSGAGYWGRGAELAYDFSGGGAYVAAYLTLPAPTQAVAAGFWVRSPSVIRVRMRIEDSSGQWLQCYPPGSAGCVWTWPGPESEHNFGLLAHDYPDKPAMQAVRTLSALASSRVLTGFVPIDSADLTALRLDGTSDMVVALRPRSGQPELDLLLHPPVRAIDLLGRSLPLQTAADGLMLTLSQDISPVYLIIPNPGRARPVTLVPLGALWRYRDRGENLGTAWTKPNYDDHAWSSGPAPLGYGEPAPATTVSYGSDANNIYLTTT